MKKKYIAPANVLYDLCLKDSVLNSISVYTSEDGPSVASDSEWDTQKKHPIWGSESGGRPW